VTHNNSGSGFSLTEFLIVIACVAVLITAAVPNIFHLQKEWILWNSARSLAMSLQWGRMHAISANTPLRFEVDESGRNYSWVDPESNESYANSVRHLPADICIVKFPRRPLRFYQHGNAAPAGTYTLEGDTGSYSVVVSPGGRIRIQRN
jgi:prepilin-type N-terminal cleavage/methylation domain-containing protein